MILKVNIQPQAFNFPNLHDERVEIEAHISELTASLSALNELSDWKIWFKVSLDKLLADGSSVGVFKKGFTYPSDLMKEYTIYISIPSEDETSWGIRKRDFIRKPTVDKNMLEMIDIHYSNFSSLSQYIVEASKKGIEHLLRNGISLKGVKISL